MGTLWRSRQWRELLNLIDHLPFHSHFKTAQLNDPEYVATLEETRKKMESEGKKTPKGNLIHEATPEVREIRRLIARIDRLTNVVLGAVGSRPIKAEVERYIMADPGGETELERRKAVHASIVARMLPGRAETAPATGSQNQTK